MLNTQNNNITYMEMKNFASYVFDRYNGIVNNVFPATSIIFDINPDIYYSGLSEGSIVYIYLPNILSTTISRNGNMLDRDKVFGMICYVVIHELLHLEQNQRAYDESPYGVEVGAKLKELSCHALTYDVVNRIKSEIEYTTNIKLVLPDPSVWYNELVVRGVDYFLRFYFKITNPLDKLLYLLDRYTFYYNLENPELRIENIIKNNNFSNFILKVSISKYKPDLEVDIMRNGIYNDWRVILPTVNIITIKHVGSKVSIESEGNTCVMKVELDDTNTEITFVDNRR